MKTESNNLIQLGPYKYVRYNDRLIWVPSGGADDGDGGGDGGAGEGGQGTGGAGQQGSGGGTTKTFTQEDVNQIAAQEKRDGRRAAEAELLKKLGFESTDAAEAFIKTQQDAERERMSEVERREADARAAEAKAASDKAAADLMVHTVRIERALERAGVPAESSGEVAKMVSVAQDATDDSLVDTVKELKKKFPALFSGTTTTGGTPDGDPGNGGGNNQGGQANRVDRTESQRQAREELERRHPEIAARRTAQQTT